MLAILAGACGGGNDSTPSTPTAPAAVLTTVSVSVSPTSITVGQTATASASGLDQNGAPISVGSVTWSTSASSIATVSASGVVTGVAPGQALIIATSGTKTGGSTVTVTAAPPAETLSGVYVEVSSGNQIVGFQTTIVVPAKPPAFGTLFLWPGLQPTGSGSNFLPINNGVLQPVLTWGPSCAPGAQPAAYSTWWVSGQYVNTFGSDPGFTGCQGGAIMAVSVEDSLTMALTLSGTIWTEVVTDVRTGQSVSYQIDLRGQAQGIALFEIEGYSQLPAAATVFANSSIAFGSPQSSCVIGVSGEADASDVISAPVLSNGNLTCRIASMMLYAPNGAVSARSSKIRGRLW